MVEVYTKSPLTFEQQLQQLKDRGLIFDNDDLALSHLKTISYYRLSAYWHPYRKIEQDGVVSDYFKEGTHFNEVMRLYEFDRRLRLLVMDAIERIEVYARTLFAYQIGHRYGTFGHTEAANFHSGFKHADWFHTLAYIRNVCSHHGRLWNRELAIRPGTMRSMTWNPPVTPRKDRIFYVLLILRYLLQKVHSIDEWKEQCNDLLKPTSEDRKWRAAMGIPENWTEHPVWQ